MYCQQFFPGIPLTEMRERRGQFPARTPTRSCLKRAIPKDLGGPPGLPEECRECTMTRCEARVPLALARRPARNLRRAPCPEGESPMADALSNRARLHGSRCDSAARER